MNGLQSLTLLGSSLNRAGLLINSLSTQCGLDTILCPIEESLMIFVARSAVKGSPQQDIERQPLDPHRYTK